MALADFGPFAGKVFIRWDPATHHKAALLFGAAASAPASSTLAAPFRRALVFFSDGSAGFRTSDPSGKLRWTSASAVYRLDAESEWAQRGWPSTLIPGSAGAELYAHARSLETALEVVEDILDPSAWDPLVPSFLSGFAADVLAANSSSSSSSSSSSNDISSSNAAAATTTSVAAKKKKKKKKKDKARLFVLSDSMDVLTTIKGIHPGKKLPKKLDPALLREVCELSQRLADLGVVVELHWVPGHKRVLGNEMADRAAMAHRPDSIDPGRFPPAKPEEMWWERGSGQVVGRAEKRRREEEDEELVEGEGEGKKRKVEVE
ncbi:hypothetical protein SLS56_008994 [Neofusicoccum ribis]|uniref:RNase H type-1 domain-containing protein n=1 Tax=Neofusicoccum ribis TaxID=45134 RepID=A0ABR3SIG5_9PEZI